LDSRNKAQPIEKDAAKRKHVEHPVAHFRSEAGERMFNGHGMAQTLGLAPGFMALNGVPSDSPLVFFTDGADVYVTGSKRRSPS
jgi:hypothetical protein